CRVFRTALQRHRSYPPFDTDRGGDRFSHGRSSDSAVAGHRRGTLTRVLPPVVMAKPRTSTTGNGAEAGYQAPGWPPAMVQPPAAESRPWALMTCNSHVVPAGIPLT